MIAKSKAHAYLGGGGSAPARGYRGLVVLVARVCSTAQLLFVVEQVALQESEFFLYVKLVG